MYETVLTQSKSGLIHTIDCLEAISFTFTMMKLPTSGKNSPSSEKHKKHVQKMALMIQNKSGGVVAHSVHTLAAKPVNLGAKINSVLKKSSAKIKKTNKSGAAANVQSIKKNYGWSWKRSLKVASVFGVILLITTVLLTGVGVAFAIDAYQKAPVINQSSLQAKESSIVYLSDGKTELFRFYGTENRKNVDLDQVPLNVQYAIIGLEEKDFYKQDLPWLSIVRAVQDCVVSRVTGDTASCAGASGLAQQLYRNVTGDRLSNIQRKIRELFAAKKLLDTNSKDQILELYLNWVPFGKNIAGVQVAAEEYFGKDVKDVTLPQACMIASMPQNPANFENGIYARENKDSPNYKFWEALVFRKNVCLENLYTYDIKGDGKRLIETQEQLDALKVEDLGIIPKRDNRKYPHFQDFVEKELLKIFPNQEELNEGGYRIVTTLNPDIQTKLDAVYDSQENKDRLAAGLVNNGAAVILDGATGHILAMRGSMDYNNTEIDGQVNIVDSPQQPGSTMKIYDYAAMLEAGFNPSTVLMDVKTDFGGGYSPNNFAGSSQGLVTAAYALQNSLNISAVRSAYLAAGGGQGPDGTAGMTKVIESAERAGLRFPTISQECKLYVSSSLGACDVNMLSHATAYNTFAQDGNLRTASPFISITREPNKARSQEEADADNARIAAKLNEVYPKTDAVVRPEIARQMQSILSDQSLRTYGSSSLYLTLPNWPGKIAAKTGTSTGGLNNEASDFWTAGFSKKYTVVTWAGNTRNELVNNGGLSGIFVIAPTWQSVMSSIHEGLDPNDPAMSFSTEGLVRANNNCPPGTKGGARCNNELMTPEQADIIKNAQNNLSKADYDPFAKTIFENRNEAVSVKKYVSKFDRKVVDKDKFPAEYVEEVTCIIAPSAFPQSPNWRNPANTFAGNLENKCNERSTIDPNAIGVDMSVSPGLSNGQTLNNPFTISAKGRVENQNIKRIEFKVDGTVVDANDGPTLTVNPGALGVSGTKFVVIRIVDSFDKAYEFNYSGIVFQELPDMEVGDIGSGVVCTPTTSANPTTWQAKGTNFTCSFNLPNGTKWTGGNNMKLRIRNADDVNCTYQIIDRRFVCNPAPTSSGVTTGSNTIRVSLKGNSFQDTSSVVYLLP